MITLNSLNYETDVMRDSEASGNKLDRNFEVPVGTISRAWTVSKIDEVGSTYNHEQSICARGSNLLKKVYQQARLYFRRIATKNKKLTFSVVNKNSIHTNSIVRSILPCKKAQETALCAMCAVTFVRRQPDTEAVNAEVSGMYLYTCVRRILFSYFNSKFRKLCAVTTSAWHHVSAVKLINRHSKSALQARSFGCDERNNLGTKLHQCRYA